MSYNPSSPVTGAPQTGLTSPTYTITSDVAPDAANGRQHAVTALGGTQTGVTVHSVQSPFTIMFYRPKVLKALQGVTNQLNLLVNVPRNTFGLITRKGVTPLSGQPTQTMLIRSTIEVPAGADTADASNVRAALSLHFGVSWAQSSGIGDTCINGVI